MSVEYSLVIRYSCSQRLKEELEIDRPLIISEVIITEYVLMASH